MDTFLEINDQEKKRKFVCLFVLIAKRYELNHKLQAYLNYWKCVAHAGKPAANQFREINNGKRVEN
jgi:hypothetical protein